MKVSFLCNDSKHPVNEYLNKWILLNKSRHDVILARRKSDLSGGDILFLISCSEIVCKVDRAAYQISLVLHASAVPHGRGWSPHIWEIIQGAETITLSLLEAEDNIDSGKIWKQLTFPIPRHTLWDEINSILFKAEIELIDFAIEHLQDICPYEQPHDIEPLYYRRRTPEDSRIDPRLSIVNQFNQIRVCDPHRFPVFFDLYGHRYKLTLEKMNGQIDNH